MGRPASLRREPQINLRGEEDEKGPDEWKERVFLIRRNKSKSSHVQDPFTPLPLHARLHFFLSYFRLQLLFADLYAAGMQM